MLAKWLDKLYTEVPECFAECLVTDTFHMTLHDLSNSENFMDIAKELAGNEKKVRGMCEKKEPLKAFEAIKMKSKCIFNMVNTSLVLGLYPADEKEHEKLMSLYEMLNEVKELYYQHFNSMNHYENLFPVCGKQEVLDKGVNT